ncbi:MAG: UDP-N-acetylmuramoyl-L-alanine--D-glutamate ligase [Hespellia sp.]|nr:UDP-N-acetylmuramoyl-L-alanine--D-glutamate ligase [Hespellia sp.]
MDLKDKIVLVFGSGVSGIAASRLLQSVGAKSILYDGNEALDKETLQRSIGKGTKVVLGTFEAKLLDLLDLVVMSPGVPTDLPVVNQIRECKIPIWGEVELAYRYGKGDVLAITGTNGKTTTTALLGEIMKAAKDSVYVVGNIGNPYTEAVLEMTEDTVAVAEMSSFQLETIDTFRPKVSAILNFTPDHLNRHHTMEAYMNAKKNIAKNQTADDYCVLNYEDEETRAFGEKVHAKVVYFSSVRPLENGIYLENGNIIYNMGEKVLVCNVNELKLLGTHNFENVMAAIAMAAVYGVPMDTIRKVIKAFAGVEHRIEFVAEKKGVAYYNDSKGTNPDAAIKGIQAMNRPTWLIGGGYDKDSTYDEWIESFDGKVRKLVLLGATKEKIAETARKHGFEEIVLVDTFEEAVDTCAKGAKEGEAVLLSPACASWGMFKNYEIRGERFKELVNRMEN